MLLHLFIPHVLTLENLRLRQHLLKTVDLSRFDAAKERWMLDLVVQEGRRLWGTARHPKTNLPLPRLEFPTVYGKFTYRLALRSLHRRLTRQLRHG